VGVFVKPLKVHSRSLASIEGAWLITAVMVQKKAVEKATKKGDIDEYSACDFLR
jgi:hypothetical protein